MYIDVIVSLYLPIVYVENKKLCHFGRKDDDVSVKAFRETVFNLVELVELSIRQAMKETRWAFMYDGWTHNGNHYLVVCAVATKTVTRFDNGYEFVHEQPAKPLLSFSQIAKPDQTGEIAIEHTASFDATTHIRHIDVPVLYQPFLVILVDLVFCAMM